MKKILLVTAFMLAMLAWATAQQPGGMPDRNSGQATMPGAQTPGTAQRPGSAGQEIPNAGAPAGSQSPEAAAAVTEGCLGGSNPNFTITDKAGTTYKLNIPPSADASPLNSHVGESVQVMGQVNSGGNKSSIDVNKIGKGTGNCGAGNSSATQPPKKQ